MNGMRRWGLILALGAALAAPAAAQQPAGTITGRVVRATTRQPIAEAVVRVVGAAAQATTGSDGRFTLAGVAAGVVQLRTSAIGFEPLVTTDVVVSSGKPVVLEIALAEAVLQLAELEVGPSYFPVAPDAATSTQRLGTEEVRRAPGVQEDVVRAVALFPGVGVTTGGRNDLVVRGGAPFENLFLVDGIEVPNINHFGSQGSTGGPLSLLNIDLVREAEFSSGGFDVKYGDRTASVTRIDLREGNDRKVGGEVNLSATGFSGIVEGPLWRGANVVASVRRSYLDLLFKLADFSFVPEYWDAQFKATQRLGANDQLSLVFVGALDNVEFNNETADDRYDNSTILGTDQKQYFSGLTWRRTGSRTLLTTTLGRTWTRFSSSQADSLGNPLYRNESTEGELTLRADLVAEVSRRLTLSGGNVARVGTTLDYDVILPGRFRLDQAGRPRPLVADTSLSAFRNATYAQAVWRAAARVELSAGLRGDWYDYLAGQFRLSPRVGARLDLTARSAVTASVGRYYQGGSYIWLVGDPGNRQLDPWHADQAVLGWERLLRPDLKLRVEGYYKRYRDYPARVYRPQAVLALAGFEDVQNDIPSGLEPLANQGRGTVVGGELFLQKKLSEVPVYGLLSLSVSRARFRAIDGAERPGAFDAPVIGTTLVGWRPNQRWELSGKLRVASGLPTTPFITTGRDAGRLDFTQYNAGPRLPTFHALDLRVDRRWSYGSSQLIVYLDVQNVYGRKNVTQVTWDARAGAPTPNESLGVLPTIGVNLEF